MSRESPTAFPAPPAVTLRAATAADTLCIGVLATQVFLDTYATGGIRPSLAREVLEHLSTSAISALLARPATVFIVAEVSGHMVGFAQVTLGARHPLVAGGIQAELNRLYVHTRFSGQGIGKALLRRAERQAAEHGASAMWLTAWVENGRALAFYASRGYTDVGATPYVFETEAYENRVFAAALDERV